MSQLHTVTMDRVHIVSRYGPRGERLSETKDLVKVVMRDLPYSTALTYKKQFPDANVVITSQEGELRAADENWKTPKPDYRRSGAAEPTAKPKIDKIVAAATSGSLASALEK